MSGDDLREKLRPRRSVPKGLRRLCGEERLAKCRKEVDDFRAQLERLKTFELMATDHRRSDE